LWANFRDLIGIFSQSVGPSLAIWANPVQFSFMVVIKASASLTHAVTAFGESNSHSTSSEQVAEQQGSASTVPPCTLADSSR
jgi:hypothetical protein